MSKHKVNKKIKWIPLLAIPPFQILSYLFLFYTPFSFFVHPKQWESVHDVSSFTVNISSWKNVGGEELSKLGTWSDPWVRVLPNPHTTDEPYSAQKVIDSHVDDPHHNQVVVYQITVQTIDKEWTVEHRYSHFAILWRRF